MQEKLREMQDKRREIIEGTIRREGMRVKTWRIRNDQEILLMTNTFLTHIPHVCSEHV
jgi:hypothetical protein